MTSARAAVLCLLAAMTGGCRGCNSDGVKGVGASGKGPAGAPAIGPGDLRLTIVYGSEKKSWLEEQARAFEATGPRTASGKRIRVDGKAMGSGEAMQAILGGEVKPAVYSPASSAYVTLLNDAWLTRGGRGKALAPAGDTLVLSPIVIAIWKPMAEALGWPGKALGWRDLLRVSTNPGGWGAFGHPEWGRFKFGHTHPEYSNSGLLAVLAEAYAGAGKTRGLDDADLDSKGVRDFMLSVERSIVHYGKSTGFFADRMRARGPGWLSAVILYENLVIESYAPGATAAPFPIVSLYPREGTFWSDHPYSILDGDWVGPEDRDAAQQLLAFLKARPAQERALQLGFRPGDPAVQIGAPIDEAHGADPRQPQTLLEVPAAATLGKLLTVWRGAKRATSVTLVFDKSGSMEGDPLAQAKRGARMFLDTLHGDDSVTLLAFDNTIYPALGPLRLAEHKDELAGRIDGLFAGGGTSLYDATWAAVEAARAGARREPGKNHAVVVMTDGVDESSTLKLDELKGRLGGAEGGEGVSVFTIAYGPQASMAVLGGIAEAARGTAVAGSVGNIVSVFQEVAAFF